MIAGSTVDMKKLGSARRTSLKRSSSCNPASRGPDGRTSGSVRLLRWRDANWRSTGEAPILPASAQVRDQTRMGPRTVLSVGFGVLLILMGIMCVDALRILGAIEMSNAQIRRDFLYREHTLEQIRSDLYESGNVVRDLILAGPSLNAPETSRAELQSIRDEMTSALKACIQSLPEEERNPFQHLAVQLGSYWSTLDPIFESDGMEKHKRGYSFLRADVLSQHATVLALAKEVSALNERELKEGEGRIADLFTVFRSRLQTITTIALILGLILAFATTVYTARLEKRSEDRYQESLQAQRELKDLSKQLVDAQERERCAISRELHDEVGQSLSALLMDVENLAAMPEGDSVFRQGVKTIKNLAENCVNEVRNMALLLRPSMLDDLGLVAALEWQGREVSKRTGMLVDIVDENVSDALPEEYKTCVYRIVQEALNNSAKHADARSARVILRQERERLLLTIQDDGKGFDPRRVRGLGLVGMNERVSHLGGVLKVESDPGRGTCLRVEMPVAPG
jgi:signal transduction histidine kinase